MDHKGHLIVQKIVHGFGTGGDAWCQTCGVPAGGDVAGICAGATVVDDYGAAAPDARPETEIDPFANISNLHSEALPYTPPDKSAWGRKLAEKDKASNEPDYKKETR